MPQGSLKASEYKRFRTLKERKIKMSVFRVERTGDYTVMSNHHLKNRALSLKAKGLLSLILSLPDDWDYTLRGLAYISLESVDSVRRAVTELENEGYITRTRTRDEQGRLRGTEYIIREQPVSEEPISEKPVSEKPILENPTLDKPAQAKPTLENPTQLNINIYNKNKSSVYEEINQSNQSKEAAELTEILQKCELEDFEKKTAQMLEDAVRVLYYKQSIKLSGAVLPQTEIRRLLRRVDRDTLIDAVEVLRYNEGTVQNPQGYLYSVILNAVNAEHTSSILDLPCDMINGEMLYNLESTA